MLRLPRRVTNNPSERMIYLSEMLDLRDAFYKSLKEALEVYFNAAHSISGQSDADTIMVIVGDHVDHYFPDGKQGSDYSKNASVSNPGVTLIEGEGINIAYSYGDALESDLLKSLSLAQRVELLEACIYALNERLNRLDSGGEDAAN